MTICINLEKYKKKETKGPEKTYVCYTKGTKGYDIVRELRDQGYDVEGIVAELLKKGVKTEKE